MVEKEVEYFLGRVLPWHSLAGRTMGWTSLLHGVNDEDTIWKGGKHTQQRQRYSKATEKNVWKHAGTHSLPIEKYD